MILISLDPGTKNAGVAVWEDGELASAWLARGTGWLATAQKVRVGLLERFPATILADIEFVAEKPQIYQQSKQKGEQASLIEVTLMAGATAGALSPAQATTYRPAEWKGQVPKEITTARSKKILSPDEHLRIDMPRAKSLHHNVWDAIGIGLKHLKRK